MNGTLRSTIILVTLGVGMAVLYNNCSPTHKGSMVNMLSSVSGCEAMVMSEFQRGFHPFVRANCSACHESGPGSGFFATANPSFALSEFLKKGGNKIADFAISTHKPPYTGTQHTAAVTGLRSRWLEAESRYKSCKAAAGDAPDGFEMPNTTRMLIAKPANPQNNNNTVNLTWNTGTEFESPEHAYQGGSFVLTVRRVANQNTGLFGYQFENPRFINTSGTAAYLSNIMIYVNDIPVGPTFLFADRYIPNLQGNNSRRIAPGAAFFASQNAMALQVKVAFGLLQASPIDFQPVTYQDLTAANGIFTTSCVSCHSANLSEGGVNLAAGNYNNVVGRTANSNLTLVSPYNLIDNLLYQRMSDATAPMPQGGLLPQQQRDRVRDWILDGAPNVPNDIAR